MVYILIAPYSQDLIKVYEIKLSSDNISHFMEIKAYTITKKEENWIFCINIYICMNWYTYAAYYIDILIYIWHYLLPALMIASKMHNPLALIYFSDFVNKKFIGYHIFQQWVSYWIKKVLRS